MHTYVVAIPMMNVYFNINQINIFILFGYGVWFSLNNNAHLISKNNFEMFFFFSLEKVFYQNKSNDAGQCVSAFWKFQRQLRISSHDIFGGSNISVLISFFKRC